MQNASNTFVATLFRPHTGPHRSTPLTEVDVEAFFRSLHSLDGADEKPLQDSSRFLDSARVAELRFQSQLTAAHLSQRSIQKVLEEDHHVDIVIQPASNTQKRPMRLAVFDMDSTLIQQEVIDLLASYAGVETQVAEITARAMNGEIDFSESLRERVGLLRGIRATVFEDLKSRVTLTPGAKDLIKCLRALGVKTALLSGGFMPLATYIARELGIDHVHANELAAEDEILTGKLLASCVIVNAERKRQLLRTIAQQEGITNPQEIMAVGDGANDLLMLGEAGLGLAVNAKPRVQEMAPCRLNCETLLDIMHILGYTKHEIEELKTSD